MLNRRLLAPLVSVLVLAVPAMAQEMAPHRAVYAVSAIENGKSTGNTPGTYAYELKLTCDGYIIHQRLRLESAGQRSAVVSEQQTQMSESKDGKKLSFEHRSVTGGKQTSLIKGEAIMADDGTGQARFSDPQNQTVALPAGTLFPVAIARATIRAAKAGENGCAAADGSHTCGGLSTVDNSGQEWMMVDISTCSTMSGQLQAFNNTASDAAKAAADAKAAETPAPAGATSAQ